ncbi:MAG: aldehyde dehydrogenase family protein, partial [Clostridia bacterium]|nr:aldehyde dehydrogenase family protein [Clostridia bacterium]
MTTHDILVRAKNARAEIGALSSEKKNEALLSMASSLEDAAAEILEANREDVERARGKISDVMIDRLTLTEKRISDMAQGVRALVDLPDPVGRVLRENERPGGLMIKRVSVPMGVVAIIYESRPNVTSDAAALSLKSGNVCVLRTGKEAHKSATAIVKALREGLKKASVPETAINLIEDTTRDSANEIMRAIDYVDLLIPRGGAGLIRACVENAIVPCIQTGTGICHIYVDK